MIPVWCIDRIVIDCSLSVTSQRAYLALSLNTIERKCSTKNTRIAGEIIRA